MKAYKIDLSMFTGKVREVVCKALFEHGKNMGYTWLGEIPIDASRFGWIYFESEGVIRRSAEEIFNGGNVRITAADFLALESAKDEPEFKPFDKVLVRDRDEQVWRCDFFSHMDTEEEGVPFATVCAYWKQCIPYEGNEHLVGTTGVYNG